MKQIILGIIFTALVSAAAACIPFTRSEAFLTTSSPNKTYTVELTGNKNAPSLPGIEHETRLNLFKNGQLFISDAHVDDYDWFDSDFAAMYPDHRWASESVLRFSRNAADAERSLDFLVISNNTDKTVKYLKITADDLLFVFELAAKSKTRVQVPHQDSHGWIWGSGEFADGRQIKGNGANFYYKNKINEPLRYCLAVDENGLKVESPIVDGYIGSEKPNVPKNENCGS
ncbi:MAG TPA: hypothetical protein VIL74_12570 [Pyrinomonadaceae bacterium]|jgi:hypothetical protein